MAESTALLRRASTLMRERAKVATHGPWVVRSDGVLVSLTDIVMDYDGASEPDKMHVASWHPEVALAVAAWLEREAEEHERYVAQAVAGKSVRLAYANDRARHAIAVATAYLNEGPAPPPPGQPCWCEAEPNHPPNEPCPTRAYWLDVDDSE